MIFPFASRMPLFVSTCYCSKYYVERMKSAQNGFLFQGASQSSFFPKYELKINFICIRCEMFLVLLVNTTQKKSLSICECVWVGVYFIRCNL